MLLAAFVFLLAGSSLLAAGAGTFLAGAALGFRGAVACSIATLGALGIAASAQTNDPIDESKLTAGKVNIVAGVVKAEAGETVEFPVYVYNNKAPGFAATGIQLYHDKDLTPVIKANGLPDGKLKEVALDPILSPSWDYNADELLIALGTMGQEYASISLRTPGSNSLKSTSSYMRTLMIR